MWKLKLRVDGFLSPVSEFDWLVIKHNIIKIEQHVGTENLLPT